jgi:hypothetical protein
MKKILIVIIVTVFIVTTKTVYCQQELAINKPSCSEIMRQLSYFWKLDSLANNGLRLYTYDKLLKSKIDSVTKEMLISELGKPNRVWEEAHGVVYVYHTWDVSKMPKDYDAPLSCTYIAFVFNNQSKYLQNIREGDIDL